jgi:hypothetical protein
MFSLSELRKPVFLLFGLLILVSLGASASCQNRIELHASGATDNQITYTVSPSEGYYYPDNGLRAISIPRQAENLKVRDDAGDSLDYKVEKSKYLNKRLLFWNDERISDHESYTFNITYEVPRGVILYGKSAYFDQIIPFTSCEESETKIIHPENWRLNQSSAENYTRSSERILRYGLIDKGSLTLWFESSTKLSSVRNYNTGIFNITAPALYSERVISQVEPLDSFLPALEDRTDIETPEGFHLTYLPLRSDEISEEAAGQYYNGRIEVKSTQLAKKDIEGLEVLLHEVVHGYNEKLSSGSPDWWWEEGTADYIAHKILRENGYEVSIFKPSKERVLATFRNCDYDREFISDWSPVDDQTESELSVDPVFPCGGYQISALNVSSAESSEVSETEYIKDKDLLGYKYSEIIVSEIFANTTAGVSDVYNLMQQENVSFSNSTHLMNNQINYFASKATGRDLTNFLKEKGINTASWQGRESEIREAMDQLRGLESRYNFSLFQGYLNRAESVRTNFYYGNFSATERLDMILDGAETRNATVYDILSDYSETKSYIKSLEAKYDQKFYEEELQDLNKSIGYLKNEEFDLAQEKIQESRNKASKKAEKIKSYRRNIEKVDARIKSSNLVIRPFMFGAPNTVQNSRQAFENGEIERSRNLLTEAETKVSNAKTWTGVFFLVVLIIVSYIGYRRR